MPTPVRQDGSLRANQTFQAHPQHRPSQHSMLFPFLAKNVECCDDLPAYGTLQKDQSAPKDRRPSAESRILAGRSDVSGTLRFGRT